MLMSAESRPLMSTGIVISSYRTPALSVSRSLTGISSCT
jgi:hypothetical protein